MSGPFTDLIEGHQDVLNAIKKGNIYVNLIEGEYSIIDSPYAIDRYQAGSEAKLDYYGVVGILKRLLESGVGRLKNVPFFERYNEEFDNVPLIAYNLEWCRPGSAGGARYADMVSEHTDVKSVMRPRIMVALKRIEDLGEISVFFEMPYDMNLTLTCYSNTIHEARQMALDLQAKLITIRPIVRGMGVSDYMPLGLSKETVTEQSGEKIIGIPVGLYVRTRVITMVKERELQKIIASSGIENQVTTASLKPEVTKI